MNKIDKIGFKAADILIPDGVDMAKWSVVACDQYTSEPEYWEEVEKIVGDEPSTLRITLPEVYLEDDDTANKIADINRTMKEYMPILKEYKDSLVYIKRTLENGKVRHGLVGVVDLEAYDYNQGSNALIRATEGTVLDRIPPRVKVRENADLELPHVMLLIDDMDRTVIEPLEQSCNLFEKVYDFELMQKGGHIEGYVVNSKEKNNVFTALESLASLEGFNLRYNTNETSPMLFAVGDGNHSLATAKACYEQIKKTEKNAENHPARYALVEVVNLHDEALDFEPIHRVVFDTDPKKLLAELEAAYEKGESGIPAQKIKYCYKGKSGEVTLKNPCSPLEVGTLQRFLDEYLKGTDSKIDYIHGDDVTLRLGSMEGNIGFILPPMCKKSLFKTILTDGVLPRKTFSMGEAHDKRFYLECRKIK